MKLTMGKKIILVVIMIAFVLFVFNNISVYAAINTGYDGDDSVSSTGLDDAVSNSSLLKLLGNLVYAVGFFLEWILGVIFTLLTGRSDFPWADKIVFNAVPLLDVNFMNPDTASFVGNSAIQEMIKNLYSTILALASSFFGIVVGITAIKLLISTIASEKAKYKQAIVDWLVGFVMLFCIHYAISFIFYLNEQLVIVASKMVTAQLNMVEETIQVQYSEAVEELIDRAGDRTFSGGYNGKRNVKISTIIAENHEIAQAWLTLDADDKSKGLHEFLMKEKLAFWDRYNDNEWENLARIIVWAASENVSVSDLNYIRKKKLFSVDLHEGSPSSLYFQAVLKEDLDRVLPGWEIYYLTDDNLKSAIINDFKYGLMNRGLELLDSNNASSKEEEKLAQRISENGASIYGVISVGGEDINSEGKGEYASGLAWTWWKWQDVFKDLETLKAASDTSSGQLIENSGTANRLISNLADYFKKNSYERKFDNSSHAVGMTKTGNIRIENMIMYAVLVAQSLILFIAYVKRLFYVIMLAMMAPIVVVMDFLHKFGK